MEAFVYILHSVKLNRFYTGFTTLTVEERLDNHLQKIYGKLSYTQKVNDWKLFFSIPCEDYSQARKTELHIKSMKSKVYIQNLIRHPQIIEKLLLKYKSS